MKLAVLSVFSLSIVAMALTGCEHPRQSSMPESTTMAAGSGQSAREHLTAAMDYLRRADEFEELQASFQVAYHLNRWLDAQSTSGAWKADPLTAKVPRDIRYSRDVSDLGRLRFALEDSRFLQEAVWSRQIADWVTARPADEALEAWIAEHLGGSDSVEAEQLIVASRLFDWTVRNIGLDELLPYPADVAAQPTPQPGKVAESVVPAPQRGIPGPGYQFHPWQTLLYGHGDAWQRARVFILLCRQQGIDAVMLAFPGKTTTPRPRPWLPATLIGKQLFLFDTRLGLPIFGPGGRGIATLEQIVNDHSLLESLSLDPGRRYPVEATDLDEILALLDAAAPALSRRMLLVEQHLTGDLRVVLTVSPSSVAERLKDCRGVADTGIWSVPFETTWFQKAQMERIQQDQNAAMEYFKAFGVFGMRTTLVEARCLHFRGEFDSQGDNKGAKALYLETRLPREQLNMLAGSEEVQRQLGFERQLGERENVWRARLQSGEIMMRQSKMHATYWLGLAQYDTGKLDAAVEWFDRRTLKSGDASPWLAAAQYNLGRTYEQLHNIDEACRCYETGDPSPQEHGNRLRARALRQSQAKPAG